MEVFFGSAELFSPRIFLDYTKNILIFAKLIAITPK
jgi:Na+/pantothenate symporter